MKKDPVYYIKATYPDGESEILAVFPHKDYSANPGNVMCYAHVGQHQEASLKFVDQAKSATPEEYADLHLELTRIYGKEGPGDDPAIELEPVNREEFDAHIADR